LAWRKRPLDPPKKNLLTFRPPPVSLHPTGVFSPDGGPRTFVSETYIYQTFDSVGNWTKRVRKSRFTENSPLTESIEYRTISYYK
jgi:hypothetical protein